MMRLLLSIAGIVLLNTGAALGYLQFLRTDEPLPPWETSSVLRIMPRDTQVGVVLLGSSHARSMTGCAESAGIFTAGLDATVVNLAKNTSGPSPLRLYLEEFYARGNSADVLIYLTDPWAFYSPKWNEEHGFLLDEPLEPGFLLRSVIARRNPRQLFQHTRMGFGNRIYDQHVAEMNDCDAELRGTRPEVIRDRVNHLYGGPPSEEALERYVRELERLCDTAAENGSRIVIATPPTLLGELPGMEAFADAMTETAAVFGGSYFDFSNCISDPSYFVDHDHLNARGVQHFVELYLGPAVSAPSFAKRRARGVSATS